MSKSEVKEKDFVFVKTPAAVPYAPAEDCGVPITKVCSNTA
jgi:hypothetical protein